MLRIFSAARLLIGLIIPLLIFNACNSNNEKKDISVIKDTTVEVIPVLKKGEKYNFPVDENGYFKPADIASAPADKFGDEVRLGHNIITETYKYAPQYAVTGMKCTSCHLDAGLKPNALPLWGAMGTHPVYRISSDRNDNLADRTQSCFRNSMNGFVPAHDSPEMRAILSYIYFISRGIPLRVSLPGKLVPIDDKFYMPTSGIEPSSTRGKVVFESKCTSCHGIDGKGKRKEDGSYEFPPLWGFYSYNKGAAFHYDTPFLARFIWVNMPLGQDFSLTPREALDVATFINIQERSKDPKVGIYREIFGGK